MFGGHGSGVSGERLEDLFRAHAKDVLAYTLRRADRATAEEITAEVFVVAWRHIERVPDEAPVLWLYGVARRLLSNERRATRRREALIRALQPLTREAQTDARSEPEMMAEALAALSPRDRELLMLTAWEGLDATQVSVVLGCKPGAVHTRLHRARSRLAAQLAKSRTEVLQAEVVTR